VARRLVAGVQQAGGIWTLEDLMHYQVVEREPVRGRYHGMRITSAAPPSSGGIVLLEILNQLEGFSLENLSEADRIHLIVEAMRRAYRDRAEYLGDPDFVEMPLALLIGKSYAESLRRSIDSAKATPSELLPAASDVSQGAHTTHFSIIDSEGNRVAATLSINYPFGSCFVPEGTGVLLNNEMDDFSARPGTPNVYGLVGAEANAIEPAKRMLSSMTPTFLETSDRLAIVGTPGGSRIITMVLLGALAFEAGADAGSIVGLPRFHHQYLPDEIQLEPDALDAVTQDNLKARGHALSLKERPWGNMQLVILNKQDGSLQTGSDTRGIGAGRLLLKAESSKK
jgi:gamma-glutamyltranspeptidase/glutathione hydrolase